MINISVTNAGCRSSDNLSLEKLESIITEKVEQWMKTAGVGTILVVICLLFFNRYEVFKLNNIPYFDEIYLWIYLALNVGIATPLRYLKERRCPKCPKCGDSLSINHEYSCNKCGSINFSKK